jgi:hypothetical protein
MGVVAAGETAGCEPGPRSFGPGRPELPDRRTIPSDWNSL